MRAATAIVGAIAAASVLIALSLILSDGGESGQTVVTKRVVETVETPTRESATEGGGARQFGGPTTCSGGTFTVENVSCEVGEEVHADYIGGRRDKFFVEDAETGDTVAFVCEGDSEPITCRQEEGTAVVYFGE